MGQDLLQKGQDDTFTPGLPGVYILLLCDVCHEFGLRDYDILGGLGISRDTLCQPEARVSMLTAYTACQRAIHLVGDQGLGLAYARAFKVTLMGSVGLLALSSPSILSALDSVIRFVALRTPFLEAGYEQDAEDFRVYITTRMEMNAGVRQFAMEVMLVGLANILEQLRGQQLQGVRIYMACPEPEYFRDYQADLPAPVMFNAPSWSLEGRRHTFEQAPLLSNPSMEAYAREQCEQEFMQLYGSRQGIAERIADHLAWCEVGYPLPGLEQFAEWLNISPRTLKRRLHEEGASYRDLVERELYSRARKMLASTRFSITEVAQQLGYHEAASFSRAFSRWAGMSPRDYRRTLQQPGSPLPADPTGDNHRK